MSYNIDAVIVSSGSLTWDENIRHNFYDEHLAERNPFNGGPVDWSGDWSGRTLEYFEKFLGMTRGTCELVLIWEGGDMVGGYKVVDGKVTKCSVGYILTPKEDPCDN